jgi:hypothetical protein
MGTPIVSFGGNPVTSVQQDGPDGSGRSESIPQAKGENGSDSTRKRHLRQDSRHHRRIFLPQLPPLGQRNETSTGLPRCAGGIGFIASHRLLVCKGSLGVRLERGVLEKGLAFAALARQTTLLVDPARLRKKATRQL